MRIGVLILYTEGWKELANVVVPRLEKYCYKHSYNPVICLEPEPYKGFEKIERIKYIFEQGWADIVLCIDCDATITNFQQKIESIIDEQHSFWITKDLNGVNGGVFIAKKSEWFSQFAEYLLSFRGIANCEQDAISLYVSDNPEDTNIAILPQKVMNAYLYENYPEFGKQTEENGEWIEGKSFILHCPGMGMGLRKQILSTIKITE